MLLRSAFPLGLCNLATLLLTGRDKILIFIISISSNSSSLSQTQKCWDVKNEKFARAPRGRERPICPPSWEVRKKHDHLIYIVPPWDSPQTWSITCQAVERSRSHKMLQQHLQDLKSKTEAPFHFLWLLGFIFCRQIQLLNLFLNYYYNILCTVATNTVAVLFLYSSFNYLD